jgi:hypothetical protein
MNQFFETVAHGMPSWDAVLHFGYCVLALAMLGVIQYVATIVAGFKPRMQVLYGLEIVAVTVLGAWKIDYPLFQIGLPVILFLATYYNYRRWEEPEDVPELDLRKPPSAPPPESWPDDRHVFVWNADEALRHADSRFRDEALPTYCSDGRFRPANVAGRCIDRSL